MEFDESRIYQPGDDIRSLDWRVTARTGRTHTKLFREERERTLLLWVDYRPGMFFATRGRFKSVLASEAAALLAWSAHARDDRIGALLFTGQGHRELRPALGDRPVLELIRSLCDHAGQWPVSPSVPPGGETLLRALQRLRRVARPGSLLVLISDFTDLDERSEQQIGVLGRHNDLVLLQLSDPLEQRLPEHGHYLFGDGLERVPVDCDHADTRASYARWFEQHRARLARLCRRHGIHHLQCDTNQQVVALLQQGFTK